MAGTSDLQFDEASHTYHLDGRRLPSVSEVLQGTGQIDSTYFTNGARMRGSHVAVITDLYDRGVLPIHKVAEGLRGYLNAWIKFRQESGIKLDGIEEPVYHEVMKYAGRVDRFVEWPNEPSLRAVLEIKSGVPFLWHKLQTAAYALAVPRGNRPPLRRSCVYLRSNGTYRCVDHVKTTELHAWTHAVSLYHFSQKARKKDRDYESERLTG